MKTYTVTLSNAEDKAMLAEIISVQSWLEEFVHDRARKAIARITQEHAAQNPKHLTSREREDAVIKANIESAADREIRVRAGK